MSRKEEHNLLNERNLLIARQQFINAKLSELKMHKQRCILDYGHDPSEAHAAFLENRFPLVEEKREIELRLTELRSERHETLKKEDLAPILLRIEAIMSEIRDKIRDRL